MLEQSQSIPTPKRKVGRPSKEAERQRALLESYGKSVYAWAPQPGPQAEALVATWCTELFFGGSRGGGKTDFLLGDFLQDVNKYGKNWQGILIRKTIPELDEVIARSRQLFPTTGATWAEQKHWWTWPNGAKLKMRYLDKVSDAERYQGHSYCWVGFDELANWADSDFYMRLKACLRWGAAEVPTKRMRATGNPGGVGHHWVKSYFIDPCPTGYKAFKDPATGRFRMFIPSRITDNKILLERDPLYIENLKGVGSPELVRAWLEGDWNAVTGAFFPEFGQQHIVIPVKLPSYWPRFRSFDWGSAKPFSCIWWAVSDGSLPDFPRGAIVAYKEWYGASAPNKGLRMMVDDVARGIKERDGTDTISFSVADPSIFKQDGGPSLAENFSKYKVYFRPADNSRLPGWEQLRARLVGHEEYQNKKLPMIYFFSNCRDSIRTLPTQQHDTTYPEDLDTNGEDHCCDSIRYACMARPYVKPMAEKTVIKTHREISLTELFDRETGNKQAWRL